MEEPPREHGAIKDELEDPSPVTDDTWINALKTWCKHVSSEVPKQLVVTPQTWKGSRPVESL